MNPYMSHGLGADMAAINAQRLQHEELMRGAALQSIFNAQCDRAYDNGAPGVVHGAFGGENPSAGPLMPALAGHLGRVLNVLGETNSSLIDLRSRVFGPWPENGENGSQAVKGPPAQRDEIFALLDQIMAAAIRGREHAETLNARI